jgi:hypothetical protein
MFSKKIAKSLIIGLIMVSGSVCITNSLTSCRVADYDTRASVSVNSTNDFYNFFSSKKCGHMISPKPTKDYSMGFNIDHPFPSNPEDYKDY